MIAGVMSGLAAYTNTDVTWWRLGIVLSVLIYGFGILAYIVLAIVLPSAKTPEEQLQMQGREVTPQNLANVVVENGQMPVKRNGCLGAFVTALLVLFAVIVGLPLLVSLFLVVISFIVVFTVPTAVHLSLPFDIGFLELPELITLYPWAVVTFMVGLLLTLLIPVYAIAHMFFSRANKIKPMGIGQRIFWVVLWVASLCCMIPSLIWIQEKNSERHHNEYSDTVIYQRMEMDRESKDFLRQGDWTIVKAENCAHYTYCGYYNDNPQVRFLDTFNEDCKEVFHVEHKERVESGVYRLECMARAEGPGTCIFAVGEGKHLSSIPVRSQIDGEYSMGWTPIVIDNIVVSDNGITYGMSSDSTFTGLNCRAKWFSAIDFKLEKIK